MNGNYGNFITKLARDLMGYLQKRPDVDLESVDNIVPLPTFDLGKARNNVKIHDRSGCRISVTALTGTASIRFNRIESDQYRLRVGRMVQPFETLYLTNTAQAGKQLVFIIGYEAYVDFQAAYNVMKIINVADQDINPATIESVEALGAIFGGGLTTPTCYNVTMTNANEEYEQALPADTKSFLIHTQDGTPFRLSFETGKVATPTEPYFSILSNSDYYEKGLKLTGKTAYFASGTAGKVAEIIAWT